MFSLRLAKTIKAIFYALALTPLIITPGTIFPFVFGRGLLIQFLAEIIIFLYLLLAIANKNYRPKKNIVLLFAGGLLFSLLISSFLGVDFSRSFWSIPERFTGWFYLAHCFGLFLAAGAIFRNEPEWRKFVGWNAAISIPMFGIAVLSLFGFRFWGVDLGTRISGTLGNPIFLAAYFILVLIFSSYLFFSETNKKYKFFWLASAAIMAYGVILTQSRGAFLGLLVGVILGIVYYAFYKNKKAKTALAFLLVLFVVLSAAPILFRNSSFIKHNEILNRYAGIFNSSTGDTRLMGWKIALLAIADKPFFGWGMENFNVAFNKYYDPEFLRFSYYETWFDKPHNAILEIAVGGGAVGTILYLGIFAACFYVIRKKQKNGILQPATAAVLLGGLAAYFVQNFFAFDTPVSYLLFFILLAFISQKDLPSPENKKIFAIWLLLIGILAVSAAWILNILPMRASGILRNAVATPSENGQKVDLSGYKAAGNFFNPYIADWRADLSKAVISDLRANGGFYSAEEVEFALEELEISVEQHSKDAYGHMLLGEFYGELGAREAKYFALSKQELDKALELSPERQHIYFGIARLHALMGEKEKMIETYKKAIELAPDVALSYWEGAKQLYIVDEKNSLVMEWLIKIAENNYLPGDKAGFLFLFQNTYQYFLEKENYAVLSGYFGSMEEIEPTEAKWHAQRATAEYMLGNKENALMEVQKTIKLDQSYQAEGEKFIKLINGEN